MEWCIGAGTADFTGLAFGFVEENCGADDAPPKGVEAATIQILAFAARALHAPLRSGADSLVGSVGIAKTDIAPSGMARAAGELWSAELADGAEPISKGERIRVVAVEGVHLKVEKAPRDASA
jgi:membrane-bound ClpP family serine protease